MQCGQYVECDAVSSLRVTHEVVVLEVLVDEQRLRQHLVRLRRQQVRRAAKDSLRNFHRFL